MKTKDNGKNIYFLFIYFNLFSADVLLFYNNIFNKLYSKKICWLRSTDTLYKNNIKLSKYNKMITINEKIKILKLTRRLSHPDTVYKAYKGSCLVSILL